MSVFRALAIGTLAMLYFAVPLWAELDVTVFAVIHDPPKTSTYRGQDPSRWCGIGYETGARRISPWQSGMA